MVINGKECYTFTLLFFEFIRNLDEVVRLKEQKPHKGSAIICFSNVEIQVNVNRKHNIILNVHLCYQFNVIINV